MGSQHRLALRRVWLCTAITGLLAVQHALPAQTVMVNQVGYRPGMAKFVFATVAADSFHVRRPGDAEILFSGPLTLWKSADPSTGMTVYRGDFTAFQQPGRYEIVTADGRRSAPFTIADSVYDDLLRKAIRFYYYQRCGSVLSSLHAGPYARNLCHIADAFFHGSSDSAGFMHTTGGWHDAGDFGKYVVNAGITVGTLLMAYEAFPERFSSDALGIPESGNGVPDLLDEVRYELEWLLRMQAADGRVFTKVTSERFAPMVMPHLHREPRYIYAASTTATADLVAVAARAARVYRVFDPEFADRCLEAARRGWAFLQAHPDILPPGGFRNPPGTETGEYGDTSDADERLWAAAELFAATAENAYHDDYLRSWQQPEPFNWAFWWGDVHDFAHLTYLHCKQPQVREEVRATLRGALVQFARRLVDERNRSGFHVLLEPGEYFWGSNSLALNQAVVLIFAYELSGQPEFLRVAADQLHYVLGTNALNMSMVTGVGTRSPQRPHHRPSEADAVPAPIPGMLVGGPNQFLNDPALKARFTGSTPPALAYLDVLDSYASNEVAINWNAPLVFVAGYVAGGDRPSTAGPGQASLPVGFELHQNYPNPFNGETVIRCRVDRPGEAVLEIYNAAGQLVDRRVQHLPGAGECRWRWDAVDRHGREVGSGVFFYRVLAAGGTSPTRKMVVLR